MQPPGDWRREARRLLRAQLALKDLDYKGLARALEKVGIDEKPKSLANKVQRGTFSFSFFLQCMYVLDVKKITLWED